MINKALQITKLLLKKSIALFYINAYNLYVYQYLIKYFFMF